MNGVETPNRDEQSDRATDQTEESAFDEDQPHQAPATRAHRGAHGQFLAARKGPRELQIGNICAGDRRTQPTATRSRSRFFLLIADSGFEQSARVNRAASV